MAVGAVVFAVGTWSTLDAQTAAGSTRPWSPPRLADGQPDIQGMWNNEEANFTPLELPKELAGRTTFTPEELQARAEARLQLLLRHAYEHVPYYRQLFQHLGMVPKSEIAGLKARVERAEAELEAIQIQAKAISSAEKALEAVKA